MVAEAEVRWFSVREWEAGFWRLGMTMFPVWLVMVLAAAPRDPFLYVCLGGITVFAWRSFRGIVLAVALAPDALLVRRALSFGVERICLSSIRAGVMQPHLGSRTITLYRRNRLQSPLFIQSVLWPCGGFGRDEWLPLVAGLRDALGPLGKWIERPWWWPMFWF